MEGVFERSADRVPGAIALECGDLALTYAELDGLANRVAHYLLDQGIGVGSRVAIFVPRSVMTYTALLGTLKSGATFVPIDPGAPVDRVAYVVEDAGVEFVLTCGDLLPLLDGLDVGWLALDRGAYLLDEMPTTRPRRDVGADPDPAAYILYTSGSSGRPKGVEIAQSSICNFLDIVPTVYDVRPNDRVYQGMTISFDFSIEEIWPTWERGATLVAGPTDSARLGAELADFLDERAVTILYCVPTLLATLPRDLPAIRGLLVGGEACPRELVDRWSSAGRRILNTYGPTEATVTATWGELRPGRPVTIGRPLPTYGVAILDDDRRIVPDGEVGEICIAGPGVARGYVGRPDLTADRFIDHEFAGRGKLYRTGDLGRWTAEGEIEYLGRADAEVKVRGHRVDLGEIESVLLEDDGVAEAVVTLHVPEGDDGAARAALASYVVLTDAGTRDDAAGVLAPRLAEAAAAKLPAYMVPALVDVLDALPVMPSGKVERRQLPAPTGRRLSGGDGPFVEASDDTERAVRAVWADVFGLDVDSVSVEADFFDDLGGHSLAAAHAVSALRELGSAVAVRDLYTHPTVRSLASVVDLGPSGAHTTPAPVESGPAPLVHPRATVAAAGRMQAVVVYLVCLIVTLPVTWVYTRNDGDVSAEVLVEMMIAILGTYLVVRWVVPVLAARTLVRGIEPGRYPLWGRTYLRVWALDLCLAMGALPVVSGSALMSGYLRTLGARVGLRTTIATSAVAMPSLVEIGDDATIGYGTVVRPWAVEAGWLIVAPISVGARAYVGANAVLEPGVTVSDDAAVLPQSMVPRGTTVPARARWAGSPAAPATEIDPITDHLLSQPPDTRPWRIRHVVASVLGLLTLEVGAVAVVVPSIALVWWFLLTFSVLAGLLATLATGVVYVLTVCLFVAAGKWILLPRSPSGSHPARSALGVRKWMVDKLLEFSLMFTNPLYATLYTPPWLRLLGARVGPGSEVSTVAHIDPDQLDIGAGSFVADMVGMGGSTCVGGRIAFARTVIGERTFVGNASIVPAGAVFGDDALLGVVSVPPPSGVPDGTSWLGSPAMVLPRRQDSGDFDDRYLFSPTRARVLQRLAIEFFRIVLPPTVLGVSFFAYLMTLSALASGRDLLVPAFTAPLVAIAVAVAVVAYCAAVKRNIVGTYRPRVEPLWSTFVRRAEFVTGLYEGAAVPVGVGMLVGTPFLPVVLRWFGVDVGARTWIGTTYLTEFDLVRIGDGAEVGAESSLQTHLFEDRVMKMSTVTVESGATVGARSVVLYDAVVGEDARLGSLSLAMKGEHLPARTQWHGVPAERRTR